MMEMTDTSRMRPVYIPEVGLYFRGTFAPDRESAARQMAEALELTVKPFGVNLKRVGPSPLEWEKVDGWSTWSFQP